MTLIDMLAGIGPVAGLAVCSFVLVEFTALPFWAVLAISIPVGGIVGVLAGIALGMAMEFLLQRRKGHR
jgi:hypothetical protein